MNVSLTGRRLACAVFALFILLAAALPARAQLFLDYATDSYANQTSHCLAFARLAAGAIDTNHCTIAGWYLVLARRAVDDAIGTLPNSALRGDLERANAYFDEGKPGKGLAWLERSRDECAKLSRYWDMRGSGAGIDAVIGLVKNGDSEEVFGRINKLRDSVRLDPLQARLENARRLLQKAVQKNSRQCSLEAVRELDEAKNSLRRAYLQARLTQAKIFASCAIDLFEKGKGFRARWALGRAKSKLHKGSYMVTQAEEDALTKIGREIDEARAAPSDKPKEAAGKALRAETMLMALIEKVGT